MFFIWFYLATIILGIGTSSFVKCHIVDHHHSPIIFDYIAIIVILATCVYGITEYGTYSVNLRNKFSFYLVSMSYITGVAIGIICTYLSSAMLQCIKKAL